MNTKPHASTGFFGLDDILDHLWIGDNVVWRVDSVGDYRYFVQRFAQQSLDEGRKVIYMRFAQHQPLLKEEPGITVHKLDAYRGFEPFSAKVYNILTETGPGAFYVFDCLSDLFFAWAIPVRVEYRCLLCSDPQQPFLQNRRPDSRHNPGAAGCLPIQRQRPRSSGEGLATAFAYHVPAPRPTGRELCCHRQQLRCHQSYPDIPAQR